MRFQIFPKPNSVNFGFVNRWIVFKFCMELPMIALHRLTVGILKLITFDVSLSEKGMLSAISTREGIALSENWPAKQALVQRELR